MGIDIGGTKLYAGVIDLQSGKAVATARHRTHPERGADFFTQRLLDVTAEAIAAAKLPGGASIARSARASRGRWIARTACCSPDRTWGRA